ncbi:MAG: prolyl-tRNA synthetase associated domain-containing protein [Alphaproteobacteria bacterium]|jgi:Ala-tRNA(Pro) deacylase|nr:prolyl-tRNA synthetase associated domain-containing protein [Alphaproteobacteria bacterium]MDP6566175.1 prolyl-tRNA synthetase associated domain-containing protein [Alphaproteobacteria bacterium]MDP6816255.1 prolyl-tRNA synthetase associated domain-containing protein [Alphaproteobacteria bacterium]
MPASPDDLFRRLDELGIAVETMEHQPLFTVADGVALHHRLPGGHSKNLYMRDKKKRNWLVVTLADKDIDLKRLPEVIGASRLSFGSAERLMEFLGVEPGSVTPFALINDPEQRVEVVLDAALLEQQPLNFHPLVNTMTSAISADDLLRFIAACGHQAQVLRL